MSARKTGQHSWVHGLPFKMRFHRSKLYISAVPAALIGAFVGFMAALMGVGGGFVMVPAMIYLLRVPTSVVIGTSLFQIVFVMAVTTVLQAIQNKTVDVVLALILILGGVIGAQFGVVAGGRLKGEQLRFLLAALVLLVCLRIGWDLIARPGGDLLDRPGSGGRLMRGSGARRACIGMLVGFGLLAGLALAQPWALAGEVELAAKRPAVRMGPAAPAPAAQAGASARSAAGKGRGGRVDPQRRGDDRLHGA